MKKIAILGTALFAVSVAAFVGPPTQVASAKATPGQHALLMAIPAADASSMLALGAELAPDEFLGASEITTVELSHTKFCFCLQGVNCCGDPGVGPLCGFGTSLCVCDQNDDCVEVHFHF